MSHYDQLIVGTPPSDPDNVNKSNLKDHRLGR